MRKFFILASALILLSINIALAQDFQVYMTNNTSIDANLKVTEQSINPTFKLKSFIPHQTANLLIGQGTIIPNPGESLVSFVATFGPGEMPIVTYFPTVKEQFIIMVKPSYFKIGGTTYCALVSKKDDFSMLLDIEPSTSKLCN